MTRVFRYVVPVCFSEMGIPSRIMRVRGHALSVLRDKLSVLGNVMRTTGIPSNVVRDASDKYWVVSVSL